MNNKRYKIFLVDDSETNLQMGRDLLKEHYEVYPIPSAARLFQVLKSVMPDLILLDIAMPEVDGFEAIKMLKEDTRYMEIPVIFLTASFGENRKDEGLALGAVDYIIKPFSVDKLLSCVGTHINHHLNKKSITEKEDKDKLCVLAVDDAPDVLMAIFHALRDTYKVITLPTPKKLFELLLKTKPNLFLLDYNMPDMTGFQLIKIIKANKQHAKTPIILLTAEGTAENVAEALSLGASDFMVKPFTAEELKTKIARHII